MGMGFDNAERQMVNRWESSFRVEGPQVDSVWCSTGRERVGRSEAGRGVRGGGQKGGGCNRHLLGNDVRGVRFSPPRYCLRARQPAPHYQDCHTLVLPRLRGQTTGSKLLPHLPTTKSSLSTRRLGLSLPSRRFSMAAPSSLFKLL